MRASLRLCLALACLPFAACAQNAILELTFDFPPDTSSGAMPRYAVVQARPGNDFTATWAGSGIDGAPLSTAGRTTVPVSIVADDEMIERGMLAVRVHYCTTHDCGAIADGMAPESQFVFERAFYRGKVTRYAITVPTLPTATAMTPASIPKCFVAGCIGGTTTNYCHEDGGTHYCE